MADPHPDSDRWHRCVAGRHRDRNWQWLWGKIDKALESYATRMAEDNPIERIPINQLRQEDGALELEESAEMEPCLRLVIAEMRNADPTAELEALRQLPLDKRYVWRVVSALKWAFADFDSVTVDADRKTMKPEDLAKVMELVKLRPMQFCMFLTAMVGPEEMQRMMVEGIRMARQV